MKDHSWAQRRCRNLVWILAGTGLLIGILVFTVMSMLLGQIRAGREERDRVAKIANQLFESIDQWALEGTDAATDFLNGNRQHLLVPVRQAKRQEIIRRADSISHVLDVKDLQSELNHFEKVVWDCRRFAQETQIHSEQETQLSRLCRKQIRQLGEAFGTEGETSKANASAKEGVKSADASTKSKIPWTIDSLISNLPSSIPSVVFRDLASLTIQLERLFDHEEKLPAEEICHTQVEPILSRLKVYAEALEDDRSEASQTIQGLTKILHGSALQQAEPSDASGDSTTEPLDLLSLCNEKTLLVDARQRLGERARDSSERMQDFQAELWRRLNDVTDGLALHAAKSMTWAWSTIVLSGVVSGLLFLIVTRKIAATIAEQVAEMDRQAIALESEVEERIQAQQERERLNVELQISARQAGMAEVATGVLHNVGNVLNSVNVSANLLQQTMESRPLETLRRVAELLNDPEQRLDTFLTSHERGRHVPMLIDEISKSLDLERKTQKKELHELVNHIEHVKNVISMQQRFAMHGGAVEAASPRELVEDAVKLNLSSIDRHCVTLVRDYQAEGEMLVDKHHVLQILVNVIKNAVEAMKGNEDRPRVLTLSIGDADGQVVWKIADTGHGISADQIEQVFQLGFTTKPNGHGFGLHNSANVAKEAGGSLTAQSDGVNLGATFVLRIPRNTRPKSIPESVEEVIG